MTGFGRGVAEHGRTRATVDVRAVNHRFLDLKLRGAARARRSKKRFRRACAVRSSAARSPSRYISCATGGAAPTRIDHAAASAAHQQLAELARTLGIPGPDLALVLAQPGVVVAAATTSLATTATRPRVLTALDAALAQLAGMRDGEGKALATRAARAARRARPRSA